MTTYYVRKTGSDGAAGTSPGAAWLTIDHAANTVAAGDTVYIGAGVYRELVTMDTAGSDGSPISYIGDVDGEKTGDAGLVMISALDDDIQFVAAQRASCLDLNGKQFIVWQNVAYFGCSSAGNPVISATADAVPFEGVVFEGCAMQSSHQQRYGISLNMNAALTPATAGLIIRNCLVFGGIYLEVDENATAETNLKATIERCLGIGATGIMSDGVIYIKRTTSSTYNAGGITVKSCTFYGGTAVQVATFDSTTYLVTVSDCLFWNCSTGLYRNGGSAGCLVSGGGNVFSCVSTLVSGVTLISRDRSVVGLPMGGISDFTLRRGLGWSPFAPWEPLAIPAIGLSAANQGISGQDTPPTANDLYGNSAAQGRNVAYFYFDASDDAISDPNAKWSNDANIADTDLTNSAYCGTTGSNSSNYIFAGGTSAPAIAAGSAVSQVRVRVYGYGGAGSYEVYSNTLAETLGSGSVVATSAAYSDWVTLTPPTGGWTWAQVAALEFKAWRTSGTLVIYYLQIEVTAGPVADAGAIEGRARPVLESTVYHAGAASLEFAGVGYHDMLVPVAATSTVISVYAYRDANYAGDNPILEVLNVPGYADQSDAQAGDAETWEQLSCTIVPTAAGWCRVRLRSRDTSAIGKCYFDGVAVA